MRSVQLNIQDVIAIDGKALRRSFDHSKNQSPIYLVSAFVSSLKLTLAQEKVSEKSNEITAIPKLLDMLEMKGAIITLDAMGCQKEIALKIHEKQADYVLSLKENNGKLHDNIKTYFESKINSNERSFKTYEESNKSHDRLEHRKYYMTDAIEWLQKKDGWKDLKSIVMVESKRETRKNSTVENIFYITSLSAQPELAGHAIRSHWAIENNLHWILDVAFKEDGSRIREKTAVENIGFVRKIALNLIQSVKKGFKDMSIPRLRKKSGWDNKTLETVLMSNF